MPDRSDLCFATTNRQAALRAIATHADAVIVIGSANSSNTVALTETAKAVGCPRVLRVNRASELPDDLEGTVAVTAGASAPESLVNEVLDFLDPVNGVTVKSVTVEDEYFPPPPELREILKSLSALIELMLHHVQGFHLRRPSRPRVHCRASPRAHRELNRGFWLLLSGEFFPEHGRFDARTVDDHRRETIAAQPRVGKQLLSMLKGLSEMTDGFSVDQMEHALQTATAPNETGPMRR